MRKFMDENFLLSNDVAVELYHNHAKHMPIHDYHCHLSPKEIAEDKRYKNMTELWLGGDHYKWRVLRSNGIEEELITGSGDDYEKFKAFTAALPKCLGNPMYHWSHLELQRYFNITDVVNEKNAKEIWEKCNKVLEQKDFSARGLIKQSNVQVICTTDDPKDTLEYHIALKEDEDFDVTVLPTYRPDKSLNIDFDTFLGYLEELGASVGKDIATYKDVEEALGKRALFFHEVGCRISDIGLEHVFYEESTLEEVEVIFAKRLNGDSLTIKEVDQYKTRLFTFLGKLFAELDWSMQLHMGALRNNNTRMFKALGPDAGFDSINDEAIAHNLSRLIDSLDKEAMCPRTILYCLNPKDNEVLGTMLGNFQGGDPGKIQFGSGWWFNDQKTGMIRQMEALANLGLLSRFVGMLTDSRSFLSYTRHEYFRRILCNLLGQWVENGEVPYDMELLGQMVEDICFNNAKAYFKI